MGITRIPYNPQTDPRQYLARALMQGFGGLEKREQKKRRTGDIRDIVKYGQYQQQLSGAESLRDSLMGLTPQQRQQHRDPSPQWPAHQQFPQIQSPELQQLAAKLQLQKLLDPMAGLQRQYLQSRIDATEALTKQRGAGKKAKVYDVKTLNETLYKWTHDKDGEPVELKGNDLFTLRKMAKDSGYRLRKITLKEAKKKKFLGIDRLWPDQKEKSQWVLESATGEIIPPGTREELQPLLTGENVPDEYRRMGVTEYRPSAPEVPAGLEDLWDEMSDEEKETALQHLAQGTATVKQIKDLLK